MSDLLTKLENALDEVETQLLTEFERIRNTMSAEAYSLIDPGVKSALDEVVIHLWQELEHSGDANNLSLRTEQHEEIATRIIVIKKLLDARIPTAYLQEAERQTDKKAAPGNPTGKSPTDQQGKEDQIVVDEKKGLLASIRGFLGKNSADSTNTIRVTDQEAKAAQEAVNIYDDEGYYAPAKKLAEIAGRFETTGDDRAMMNAVIKGKAIFESRDLSKTETEVVSETDEEEKSPGKKVTGTSVFESKALSSKMPEPTSKDTELAKTPEAIRKKLENTTRQKSGASTFGARELSAGPPPEIKPQLKKEKKAKPVKSEKNKSVAQTPEEIRKKLESRQSSSQPGEKASFGAREIKHAAPQEFRAKPEKKKTPEPEKPIERPTGKAVFEVKDLTEKPSET
jgi:hypothetical protein